MTLVKIDHPRRIDQFIDYFGEPHRAHRVIPGRAEGPRQTPVSRAGGKRRTRA